MTAQTAPGMPAQRSRQRRRLPAASRRLASIVVSALLIAGASHQARAIGCFIIEQGDRVQKASTGSQGSGQGFGAIDRLTLVPGEFFTVFADFSCNAISPGFSKTKADNVVSFMVMRSDGTFEDVAVDAGSLNPIGCPSDPAIPDGCSGLQMLAPETATSPVGLVAGAAGIKVMRGDLGNQVVVDLGRVAAAGASCNADVPDPLVGGPVLVPPYNVLVDGVQPAPLQGATAWTGALLTPIDMTAFVDNPGAPEAVVTETTGFGIDLIPVPGSAFVKVLSPRGGLIPPVAEVAVTGSGNPTPKALIGTTDVRFTIQLLEKEVQLADGSTERYLPAFEFFRSGPTQAGPIVPPDLVTIREIGTTKLSAFRANDDLYVAGLLETDGDINMDGDQGDQIALGQSLSTATEVNTGLALSEVSGSQRRPATAVSSVDDAGSQRNFFALLQSGTQSREALTPPPSLARDAIQVFEVLDQSSIPLTTPPLPPVALGRGVDDSNLFSFDDGVVWSRTSELDLLTDAIAPVSDGSADARNATVDGSGNVVAYERTDGSGISQIFVADRGLGGPGALASPTAGPPGNQPALNPILNTADGSLLAFASGSTNYPATINDPGSSQPEVIEEGVNTSGVLRDGFIFFPDADAAMFFELEAGASFPGGPDWSACTSDLLGPLPVGLDVIFVDMPGFVESGDFTAQLVAPLPGWLVPSCDFDISVTGTYQSSGVPLVPGSTITLTGAVTANLLQPPLPAGFSNLQFESTLLIGDPIDHPLLGEGLAVDGFFVVKADVGAGTASQQIFLAGLAGSSLFEGVSVDSNGVAGDADSDHPDLSANGRWLFFDSMAGNLDPADSNGRSDVFAVDLDADGDGTLAEVGEPGAIRTVRLSLTQAGTQLSGDSTLPRSSDDGSVVVYLSTATELGPGGPTKAVILDRDSDGNGVLDEQPGGTTVGVVVTSGGSPVAGDVSDVDIDGAGRFVAITTAAALVPSDTNGMSDVYVLDRNDGRIERASVDIGGQGVAAEARHGRFSGDGAFLVFESDAALTPGAPAGTGLYRFSLVSKSLELLAGGGATSAPAPNANGLAVAFDSDGFDANAQQDVFVVERVDDGSAVSRNDFPADGYPDGDLLDTTLEAFDALDGQYKPGVRVAASFVETAGALALAGVPEQAQGGVNLNGPGLTRLPASFGSSEADADDVVAFLARVRPDVRKENLGVAIRAADLSPQVACFSIDEAAQSTDLNGDALTDDAVLGYIAPDDGFGGGDVLNAGFAVDEVFAVGGFCFGLVPENAESVANAVLSCFGAGPGCDLNDDGDTADRVPVAVRASDGMVFSLGVAAVGLEFGADNAIVVIDEAADGNRDLNGDSVPDDRVPAFFRMSALGTGAGGGPGESGLLVPLGPAWEKCSEVAPEACGAFPFAQVGERSVSYVGFEQSNRFSPFCSVASPTICDSNDDNQESLVAWLAFVAEDGQVSGVQAVRFDPRQTVSVHPTTTAGTIMIQRERTECQAASEVCGTFLPDPLPDFLPAPAGSCEATVDVIAPPGETAPDGLLDCNATFVAAEGDVEGDGVPDSIDNAQFVDNTAQVDCDGDGLGDVVDPSQCDDVPRVEFYNCNFDQDADVDQEDVDRVAQRVGTAAENPDQPGYDPFDLNLNGFRDVGDVRACINLCTNPDCSPVVEASGSGGTTSSCGLMGIEAVLLIGLGRALRRRRRIAVER